MKALGCILFGGLRLVLLLGGRLRVRRLRTGRLGAGRVSRLFLGRDGSAGLARVGGVTRRGGSTASGIFTSVGTFSLDGACLGVGMLFGATRGASSGLVGGGGGVFSFWFVLARGVVGFLLSPQRPLKS